MYACKHGPIEMLIDRKIKEVNTKQTVTADQFKAYTLAYTRIAEIQCAKRVQIDIYSR